MRYYIVLQDLFGYSSTKLNDLMLDVPFLRTMLLIVHVLLELTNDPQLFFHSNFTFF